MSRVSRTAALALATGLCSVILAVPGQAKTEQIASGRGHATFEPMPGPSQLSGTNLPGLLAVLVIFTVVLAPVLFARRGPAPGQSDDGSDGGGGGRPPRSPVPTDQPPGGIPIDDPRPASIRLRTHERLADRRRVRDRRHTREPDRVTRRAT